MLVAHVTATGDHFPESFAWNKLRCDAVEAYLRATLMQLLSSAGVH